MDDKEKIYREKQIGLRWEDLKPHRKNLHDILTSEKKVSPRDSIVIYQCVATVAENIDIYQETIKNETNIIKADDQKNFSKEEKIVKEIVDSIKFLTITQNKESSLQERLDAIDKIRNTCWKTAYTVRDKINNIL